MSHVRPLQPIRHPRIPPKQQPQPKRHSTSSSSRQGQWLSVVTRVAQWPRPLGPRLLSSSLRTTTWTRSTWTSIRRHNLHHRLLRSPLPMALILCSSISSSSHRRRRRRKSLRPCPSTEPRSFCCASRRPSSGNGNNERTSSK